MSRGKTDKIICFSFKHFLFTNPDIETLQRNKRRRGFTNKKIPYVAPKLCFITQSSFEQFYAEALTDLMTM